MKSFLLLLIITLSITTFGSIPPCNDPCPVECSANIICNGSFEDGVCEYAQYQWPAQIPVNQPTLIVPNGSGQYCRLSNIPCPTTNLAGATPCFRHCPPSGSIPNPSPQDGNNYISLESWNGASNTSSLNQFESVLLPLKCPLMPWEEITVTLWAMTTCGGTPGLSVWGVKENPGTGDSLTGPMFMIENPETVTSSTNWQPYSFTATNPTGSAIYYIAVKIELANNYDGLYIDNVQAFRHSDISINTDVTNYTPCSGSTMEVEYNICNNGSTIANNLNFTPNIPAGFAASNPVISGPGSATYNGTILNVSSLAPGACVALTLNLHVNVVPGQYSLCIDPESAFCLNGDPCATIDVINSPLIFTKTAPPGPYEAGDVIQYGFELINTSGTAYNGLQVIDVLPNGFTYIDNGNPAFPSAMPYNNTTGVTTITSDFIGVCANCTTNFQALVQVTDDYSYCGPVENCATLSDHPNTVGQSMPCETLMSCVTVDMTTDPNQISAAITQFPTCHNNYLAHITVSVTDPNSSGPYSYGIIPPVGSPYSQLGDPTFTGLPCGFYTFIVMDLSSGCEYVLNNYGYDCLPELVITSLLVTDNICHGDCLGSFIGTAAGGFPSTGPGSPYTWSIAGEVNGQLCAGTYDVVVTDDIGCTATQQITVTEPADFNMVVVEQPASCEGVYDGQIEFVNVIGGTPPYQHSVTGGAPWFNTTLFTNLGYQPGFSYTAAVMDANGCVISNPVNMTPNSLDFWQQSTHYPADQDQGHDIVVEDYGLNDQAGNIYATGEFDISTDFIGNNQINVSTAGTGMYLTKFTACGDIDWVAYGYHHIANRTSRGLAAVLDEENEVIYVVGDFKGGNIKFFGGDNSMIINPTGITDGMYLAKYDMNTGEILHVYNGFNFTGSSTSYADPVPSGIAIDDDKNIYISGTDVGLNPSKAFLLMLKDADINATSLESEIFGQSSSVGTDVEVSSLKEVYMTGSWKDILNFGNVALEVQSSGGSAGPTDGYVAKFGRDDQNLQTFAPEWILPLRVRNGKGELLAADLDNNGYIYVAGSIAKDIENSLSLNTKGPKGPNPNVPLGFTTTPSAIVARIAPDGVWDPTTCWMAHADLENNRTFATGITVNSANDVFITGNFQQGVNGQLVFARNTGNLSLGGTYTQYPGSALSTPTDNNVFVAQFTEFGDHVQSNFSEGNDLHKASGICANQFSVYSTGSYYGTMDFLNTNDIAITGFAPTLVKAYFTRNDISNLLYAKSGEDSPTLQGVALDQVTIYPNPTSSSLTIESSSAITSVTVRDVEGRLLPTPSSSSESNQKQIDLSNLSNGLYLIEVQSISGRSVHKVVLER